MYATLATDLRKEFQRLFRGNPQRIGKGRQCRRKKKKKKINARTSEAKHEAESCKGHLMIEATSLRQKGDNQSLLLYFSTGAF